MTTLQTAMTVFASTSTSRLGTQLDLGIMLLDLSGQLAVRCQQRTLWNAIGPGGKHRFLTLC
jgi:hypothetical protein